ncbi:MAG TPA: hypothetical protein VFZ48_03995 [Candidatus Saccharimonadales bacterium]
MICYVIGSVESEQNSRVLPKIIQVLSENRVMLAHNTTTTLTHEEVIRAIGRADIVIANATHRTFDHGFLAALCLQHKRPTLLLFKEDTVTPLAASISDRNLTVKTYAKIDDLTTIIERFISHNTVAANDLRFNFFISRDIHNYLKDIAHTTGKNKSEIIRDLLEKEMRSHKK